MSLSGNLAGWTPQIVKKDEKGNLTIFGKITVSAAFLALIMSAYVFLGDVISYVDKETNNPTPAIVVHDKMPLGRELNNVSPERGDIGMVADLIVPDSKVDVYKLVKIRSTKVADYYDLLVMTIYNGNIAFVDTVATSHAGEWVFTGPPGQYSIRLTTFAKDSGFDAITGTVTIGGNPNPTPNPNPNPQPQPNPSLPEGQFGFAPAMYDIIIKNVPKEQHKYANNVANSLADNFESLAAKIAAGGITSVNQANTELSGLNRFTFNNDQNVINAWMPFFNAWTTKANDLLRSGKLKGTVADYQIVYTETAKALREIK